jgi:hypothetical protein
MFVVLTTACRRVDTGSHNDRLDFVSSFGLCGLIGISWMSFEMVRFTWGLRGRQDGLFAGACAFVDAILGRSCRVCKAALS